MNNNNDQLIINQFKRKFVYYEKQKQDKLCGIHCLNSLVQAPYFNIENLTEIAKKLDDMEKAIMSDDLVSTFSLTISKRITLKVKTLISMEIITFKCYKTLSKHIIVR